ncbi:MAG: hypothetical protein EBS73_15110 [Betaproteobacteria bacterium]|nr:hypothetical protein [Betaproteobacteria bacterium]
MANERMMLDHLFNKLKEREREVSESIAEGSCKDFAEYRNLCGVIQGLRRARIEVQDLVQRYEEFEND